LKITNLSKIFSTGPGPGITVIKELSFEISNPALYTILAPKCAGKSTLLKILAGLEPPTSGELSLSPYSRPVYIPSNIVSFPWFNVKENFSLVSNDERLKDDIIKLTGLEGYEKHYPENKSRGFRLLMAVGMALLSGADLLLIDSPFDGVSDLMKQKTASLLREIIAQKKVAIVAASSSISDSILISDKILVANSTPFSQFSEVEVSFRSTRNFALLATPEGEELKKQIALKFSGQNREREINISI
jgi:ABC-type nitrate/sulfonate/bicarbonate transport system ATPase subunit